MRRTLARITFTAAATAGLVATGLVQALGLGEISVSSDLNQRFSASIPLTEINAEDLETVTVSVAPNEAFDRAGIDRAEYLSSLNFEIKNDRGSPRVVISSGEIAREPVLNLLVQARWSGGKILRDYTILLDPPTLAAPVIVKAPVVAKPVVAPVVAAPAKPAPPVAVVVAPKAEFYETPAESKPTKRAAAPVKAAPAVSDSAFDSATGSYGPVAAKETLWSIATKVRPSPAVSMDQVLLALAEANPVAIQRGTTVIKGAMLRIPSAERIQSTTAPAAKARLAALRGGGSAASVKAPAPATPRAAVKPAAPAPEEAAVPGPAAAAPKSATLPALPKPQIALPPAAKTPVTPPAPVVTATASSPAPVIASKPAAAVEPAVTPPPPAAPAATATLTPTPAAAPTASAVINTPAAPEPIAPPPAPATTAPVDAAPAAAKSPLAQPLPEEPESSLLDGLGIPLAVGGLVLLLGAGLFLLSRRRKAGATAGGSFTKFKPGDTSTVQMPVGGSGAPGKLGDTTRLSDTQVLGAAGGAAFAATADATQQMTRPVAAAYVPEATLILDAEAVAALNNAVKPSAVSGGTDSFDKTTQVHVETLHINLGDNDPLSEADFHLAYGLYDEAILLLKTATQQQPQRIDLQVKLAETYFAAGRPMEFQEIAEELKDKLSSSEWSKIAIMGSQICPDVAIFQPSEGDAGLDADFDLAFDEPAAPVAAPGPASNSIDFSIASPSLAAAAPASASAGLDIELDDGRGNSAGGMVQPPAGLNDEDSIDFMLGQSLTPLGAGMKVPGSSDLSFSLGSPTLDVEIPRLELSPSSKAADIGIADMNERPTLAPLTDPMSFSLQDLAVSITPRETLAESLEDELNTKLDLARAYVEMGDNDMAKSLLQEVQQQGGERYQQEAASLLQRLPG
ncbi:MAG: FimV/HubP family polar landmark protein [Pseudomonadota bacterium]